MGESILYKLRIPMVIALVAAGARLLLDAPKVATYALGGSVLLFFIGQAIVGAARLRKHLREINRNPPQAEDFELCDQRREIALGLFLVCHKQRGHVEHEHEGDLRGGSVTWVAQ